MKMRDFQPLSDTGEALRDRLADRALSLSEAELKLVLAFAEQIVANFDPDAITEFLALRSDPNVESILQIASTLDEASREQLLFDAESIVRACAIN